MNQTLRNISFFLLSKLFGSIIYVDLPNFYGFTILIMKLCSYLLLFCALGASVFLDVSTIMLVCFPKFLFLLLVYFRFLNG